MLIPCNIATGLLLTVGALLLSSCSDSQREPWNNPHAPEREDIVVYHSNFQLPPQHLDPAIAYSTDEALFIDQIYEPPLGYHFLKRPYVLEPVVAEAMPRVIYRNQAWQPVAADDPSVAYSEYTITLKPGIYYQPHPAFAKDDDGRYRYFFHAAAEGKHYRTLADFTATATRLLTADDFIYQIKRLADPANQAPLMHFMGQYIVGMRAFTEQLQGVDRGDWLDLRQYTMQGLRKIDDRTYTITLHGVYPQFIYWLATHFFAPLPWEADRFYHNPGFTAKNLTLDWYPVGTGPFMMTDNDPNRQIILARNPHYRHDPYPSSGAVGDEAAGLLADAGRPMPFIDKAVYTLDKATLPMWSKFLQGYYDRSGETHGHVTQHFDQALVMGPNGIALSQAMQDKAITLSTDVKPAVYYYGCNMLDPVVGGYSEASSKLRQAIAIAWHMEDFIDIFQNGAALPYQGPIPPGIAGHLDDQAGINPYTHDWHHGRPVRKSIDQAKRLLAEAGYPGGRQAQTGEPLRLYLDVQAQATGKNLQDWQKRQLAQLGIQLEFRATDWNRYKEKLRTGNHQLFIHGWLADYPDPENFLFLLYGPQSPVACQCDGNNAANYNNPQYNRLFERMKTLLPGPERDALVAEMVAIVRHDTPWFSGYYPQEYYLNNPWLLNTKRHGVSHATLKYLRLDSALRRQQQRAWNQPNGQPLVIIMGGFMLLLLLAWYAYRRRQTLTIR